MSWKNRRVLVTGAGGFIGSHLAEELARQGAKVRALVRYNSRGHQGFLEETQSSLARRMDIWAGDVADPHYVLRLAKDQDVVFHLAALVGIPYSYHAPSSYVSTNIQGTLNILEACRAHKVERLVVTSTSEVYGTAVYTPIDEKHPLQGQSPYSASKIAADHLAESFYRSFGLPVTIARPFNTYGPRQSARAVIPTIIGQLLADHKKLSLGSLSPVRDFNYVADTVDGFLALGEKDVALGQAVNLGSGRGVSVRETAELAMGLLGRRSSFAVDKARVRPKASEVFKLVCDNRKAKKLLGFKPRHSMEEGLMRTIHYMKNHLGQYKTRAYNI